MLHASRRRDRAEDDVARPPRGPRLTYANVVATLALFLALTGGAAVAASGVLVKTSKQVATGAINSGDVKNGSLTSSDLKDGAAVGVEDFTKTGIADLRKVLGAGSAGSAGAKGDPGAKGDAGVKGDPGVKGDTGAQGPAGPTAAAASGTGQDPITGSSTAPTTISTTEITTPTAGKLFVQALVQGTTVACNSVGTCQAAVGLLLDGVAIPKTGRTRLVSASGTASFDAGMLSAVVPDVPAGTHKLTVVSGPVGNWSVVTYGQATSNVIALGG